MASNLTSEDFENLTFTDYVDISMPNLIFATPYAFQGLLSIIFNGISFYALSVDPSIMEEAELIFIRALSAQDLVSGAYLAILFTLIAVIPVSISDPVVCGPLQATNLLLGGQSNTILLIITLDKYMRITRPLKYLRWMTAFRAKILVAVAMVYPLPLFTLAALPQSLFSVLEYDCLPPVRVNRVMGFTCGNLLVMLAVSVFVNSRILLVVRQQHKRTESGPGANEANTRARAFKAPLTVFTINIVSYTAWLVWAINSFMALSNQSELSLIQVGVISFIWQITTWINPIIMFLTNRSYRKLVKRASCRS